MEIQDKAKGSIGVKLKLCVALIMQVLARHFSQYDLTACQFLHIKLPLKAQ